ncbi:MAG: P1 family peptidase [Actinobacteria bacterium]|nr:P1 family peptidase [Actinomycetota bacterium]
MTDVPGIRVGHWTGTGTGVTVVLTPAGCIGAGEVRGGAPATREGALLQYGSLVHQVDAVVFTGGSAFGLAACDGVMAFLEERGQGFPTPAGPVPIVVGAAIFDLVASGGLRPGPAEGRAAAEAAARGEPLATGGVGVGRGATVGKWRGPEFGVAGGVGSRSVTDGDVVVGALAAVNAAGDVIGADGSMLAGSHAPPDDRPFPTLYGATNTTLVVVATNARFSKPECLLVSQSAHDGFARALRPAHTRGDGDLAVTLATGDVDASLDVVREQAAEAVASAIRDAVSSPAPAVRGPA